MAQLETPRLKIPLLATGQAHKELFHNEALSRIDLLLHPTVQGIETDAAAVDAVAGRSWIVGSEAIGDWLGHDDQIAGWTGNGWQFIQPLEWMRVYVESLENFAVYRGTWQLGSPIDSPAAGTVVDDEARSAIDSILAALQAHGILPSGV